jgi:hypothetical protein
MNLAMRKTLFALLVVASYNIASATLQVDNLAPTGITRTIAWMNGSLVSTNGDTNVISLQLFYGLSDATTNIGSWSYTNILTDVASTGAVSTNITGLTPASLYYYRWLALEGTNSAWSSPSTNFWTLAGAPTSTPPAVTAFPLQCDSNGVVLAPTNFFSANRIPTNFGTGDGDFLKDGSRAMTGSIDLGGNSISNGQASLTNLQLNGLLSGSFTLPDTFLLASLRGGVDYGTWGLSLRFGSDNLGYFVIDGNIWPFAPETNIIGVINGMPLYYRDPVGDAYSLIVSNGILYSAGAKVLTESPGGATIHGRLSLGSDEGIGHSLGGDDYTCVGGDSLNWSDTYLMLNRTNAYGPYTRGGADFVLTNRFAVWFGFDFYQNAYRHFTVTPTGYAGAGQAIIDGGTYDSANVRQSEIGYPSCVFTNFYWRGYPIENAYLDAATPAQGIAGTNALAQVQALQSLGITNASAFATASQGIAATNAQARIATLETNVTFNTTDYESWQIVPTATTWEYTLAGPRDLAFVVTNIFSKVDAYQATFALVSCPTNAAWRSGIITNVAGIVALPNGTITPCYAEIPAGYEWGIQVTDNDPRTQNLRIRAKVVR